jgi:hypothetical protein
MDSPDRSMSPSKVSRLSPFQQGNYKFKEDENQEILAVGE